MNEVNVLSVEFKIVTAGQEINGADATYEVIYKKDNFDVNGPETKTKSINKKQYDLIQFQLKNLIGE